MMSHDHYNQPAFYDKWCFVASIFLHFFLLLIIIWQSDWSGPLPVVQNENQKNNISAVVLGDALNKKLLPETRSHPAAIPKILPKLTPHAQILPQMSLPTPEKLKTTPVKSLPSESLLLKGSHAVAHETKKQNLTKSHLSSKQVETSTQKMINKKVLLKTAIKKTKSYPSVAIFQKMLRNETEQSLREQLLKEKIKLNSALKRAAQGEVNKYKALILQTISTHWLVPLHANKKRACELLIRVAPGGMVLSVQVMKTSGDPALDRSARVAVLKSSPLPVPENQRAFAAFKQFVLTVRPKNILSA